MVSYPMPHVPDPCLRWVRNLTPFGHFQCDKMGPGRKFHDTVVVKGAFDLAPGELRMSAPSQGPIALADEVWDASDAMRSSVRRAGDAILFKPATDVIVTGTARAPAGRALRAWDVAVVVRDGPDTLLRHALHVTGPCRFEPTGAGEWAVSDPEPATEVPIRYELAYGGTLVDPRTPAPEHWVMHEPNPSGVGFAGDAPRDRSKTYPAPQWHLAAGEGGPESAPAGLGPVARHWLSRRRWAGTYDEAWERRMRGELEQGLAVDYASDIDLRFFQCAHPALISPSYLEGGEEIGLTGLLGRSGEVALRLPALAVIASLATGPETWSDRPLPLDTVHIDLDAAKVYLCWRLSLPQSLGVSAAILRLEEGAGR